MVDFQRLVKMAEDGDAEASRELLREKTRRGFEAPYQKFFAQLQTRPPEAMESMGYIQYRVQYFIGSYEFRTGNIGIMDRGESLSCHKDVYTYTLTGLVAPDLKCFLDDLVVAIVKEERKRQWESRGRPWYVRVLDVASRFLR